MLSASVLRANQRRSESGRMVGDYELGEKIGEGRYSKVRVGTHITTGQRFAVKIIQRGPQSKERSMDQLRKEIAVSKQLNHRNVAKLEEVLSTDKCYFLVFELVTGGRLFDHLVEATRFDEDDAHRIFVQLISAVDYFHNEGVAHRDLKPENLLVCADTGDVKVSDFGMATLQRPAALLDTFRGTPHYLAPEVLEEKPYNGFAADVWSCGVILYMLLTGHRPFDGPNLGTIYQKISRGAFPASPYIPARALRLIQEMLTVNPANRATTEEILAHEWLQGIQSPPTSPRSKKRHSRVTPADIEHAISHTVEPMNISTFSHSQTEASDRSLGYEYVGGNEVKWRATGFGISEFTAALKQLEAHPVIADDQKSVKGVVIEPGHAVTSFVANIDEQSVITIRRLRGDMSVLVNLTTQLQQHATCNTGQQF